MAGTLTKGFKLSYKATSSGSTYTDLTNLQDFPDLGGTKDTVEVTTLDDSAHVFIDGLDSYGDSLDFTFLYDKTQFTALQGLSGSIDWKVTLPGTGAASCTFKGACSVRLNGSGVNEALTYTLSIIPNTAATWA